MAIEKLNPASTAKKERRRIPMSTPVQKLEVQDIPGYHLHWFANSPGRLKRAQDAGYEFVNESEVTLNPSGLGSDSVISGNTDMGSQVSVIAGKQLGSDGQPERLILMKIKQEWYDEDQVAVEDKYEHIAASLRGGLIGAERDSQGDTQHRYVDKSRTSIPDLFKPKRRKGV
jgi:hypothetical protein